MMSSAMTWSPFALLVTVVHLSQHVMMYKGLSDSKPLWALLSILLPLRSVLNSDVMQTSSLVKGGSCQNDYASPVMVLLVLEDDCAGQVRPHIS